MIFIFPWNLSRGPHMIYKVITHSQSVKCTFGLDKYSSGQPVF